jgi:hypothetical protein
MVTSLGELAFFAWVAHFLARGDLCADFSDANFAKTRLFANFFHPVGKPLQQLIDFLGELRVIAQNLQAFPDVQRPECVNGQ